MRQYEMMVVLQAGLDDESLASQLETIEGWVKTNEGEITSVDRWGRRRLAYRINDQRDGFYIVYALNLPPAAPGELERNLRLNENVLRYLITRAGE